MQLNRASWRRIKNTVLMSLTVLCVALALIPLGSILFSVATQNLWLRLMDVVFFIVWFSVAIRGRFEQ